MTLWKKMRQALPSLGSFMTLLASCGLSLQCADPYLVQRGDAKGDGTVKILFIGNSLTYYNDLPAMLQKFTRAAGRKVAIDSSTASDYLLKQHANPDDPVGKVSLQKIRGGGWDYVVLQERSDHSAYPHLRVETSEAVKLLSGEIRKVGARPLLYMTWGYLWGDKTYKEQYPQAQTFEGMHGMITAGYLELGKTHEIPVVPAGYAWSKAKTQWDGAGKWLWNADGNHPQAAGTLMNVGVFYAYLFHADPRLVPEHAGVDDHLAKFVLEVAAQIVPVAEQKSGG